MRITLASALLLASSVLALNTDQQKALDVHNQARARKNLPKLVWDDTLANGAQNWANELRKIGKLEHKQGGENLYGQSWVSSDALARAAQSWANEAPNYHGEKIPDGDFQSYGHYTQCMWKDTQRVGMAAAEDGKGGQYVVARYDPAGNYIGQTPF